MNGKNVLGIIYSNSHDNCLPELATMRAMGSVPFAGRYRLIDFVLSNMVNCGIGKVGVLTNENFRSLMDHIGSGRPWDLSRKNSGLFLLPPFSKVPAHRDPRLAALIACEGFIASSREEYVILADCNVICNIDYSKIIDRHIATKADITIAYTKGIMPPLHGLCTFDIDDNDRIRSVEISPKTEGVVNYSTNICVLRKSLLEHLINEAQSRKYVSFEENIFMGKAESMELYGYEITEYNRTVSSIESYYSISMELLDNELRRQLFCKERPVLTKLRDSMPTIYRGSADVKNSLIADGCIIEGEVENSLIFRGATIAKDAVVRNSIVMQGAFIGEGSTLNCVILDKNVTIKPRKNLSGAENYPFFVGKGIII